MPSADSGFSFNNKVYDTELLPAAEPNIQSRAGNNLGITWYHPEINKKYDNSPCNNSTKNIVSKLKLTTCNNTTKLYKATYTSLAFKHKPPCDTELTSQVTSLWMPWQNWSCPAMPPNLKIFNKSIPVSTFPPSRQEIPQGDSRRFPGYERMAFSMGKQMLWDPESMCHSQICSFCQEAQPLASQGNVLVNAILSPMQSPAICASWRRTWSVSVPCLKMEPPASPCSTASNSIK